jgi:2-(1,2-epoxy-1,2-dihydrophenyl)acetyl-CoA isomerase
VTAPEVRLARGGDGIAIVTLDRPHQRNALGWQTWEQLEEVALTLREDSQTRVVVLTGAGGCFSAGGDMKSSPARGEGLGAPVARLAAGHRVVTEILRLPQVTVAAVEGFAVGAGWSLALSCDLLVAAEDAFFAAPFLERGLVPDGGIAWFLTRSVGTRRAADLLLTGRRLLASEAERDGLVSRVVAPGGALASATDLARAIASGPVDAQGLTKRMLRLANDAPLERFLEAEWVSAALDLSGPEAAEGRASFAQKRPPRFQAVPR